MRLSLPDGQSSAIQRARRILGREFVAWGVIAIIAIAAVFIQSCPDHANADELVTTWSESSLWTAAFSCPVHQAFILPAGEVQGS
jgi:hypothetical protein